jgi:hypothetical protein
MKPGKVSVGEGRHSDLDFQGVFDAPSQIGLEQGGEMGGESQGAAALCSSG